MIIDSIITIILDYTRSRFFTLNNNNNNNKKRAFFNCLTSSWSVEIVWKNTAALIKRMLILPTGNNVTLSEELLIQWNATRINLQIKVSQTSKRKTQQKDILIDTQGKHQNYTGNTSAKIIMIMIYCEDSPSSRSFLGWRVELGQLDLFLNLEKKQVQLPQFNPSTSIMIYAASII